jgi:hypothetical protein
VPVGAAFDFHSGNKRAAPRVIKRLGFEWLFRFALEPRRLWRRYLIGIPVFIVGVISDLGRRVPSRPPAVQTVVASANGHGSLAPIQRNGSHAPRADGAGLTMAPFVVADPPIQRSGAADGTPTIPVGDPG